MILVSVRDVRTLQEVDAQLVATEMSWNFPNVFSFPKLIHAGVSRDKDGLLSELLDMVIDLDPIKTEGRREDGWRKG